MAEPVELHEMREHNIDEFDWAVHGRRKGEKQRVITNVYYQMGADNYMTYLREKYAQIEANEQRWEAEGLEDADYVLVAYGLPGRVVKGTVRAMRAEGQKVGFIRPITAWPFPVKAFATVNPQVKGFVTVEANATGQMIDDVALAVKKTFKERNIPTYCLTGVYGIPSMKFIRQGLEDIRSGVRKEVY